MRTILKNGIRQEMTAKEIAADDLLQIQLAKVVQEPVSKTAEIEIIIDSLSILNTGGDKEKLKAAFRLLT